MSEKIIYHIDVNSAFLSWTAAYRVRVLGQSFDLRNVPSVIAGSRESRHGIILAKSIPAKKFGVQTGEPIDQARTKCPNLIVESADYSMYVQASRRFIAILREVAPIVEQYSIDESWCDMTGVPGIEHMAVLKAYELKDRIRDELGFTVNIGISSNKLLAKMASDFKKPDRVHTLFPSEIKTKMWPLPVSDLFYVGQATAAKCAKLGIHTIGDLAHSDPDVLNAHMHSHGLMVRAFANGQSFDLPIQATQDEHVEQQKGCGNSVTIPYDVTDTGTAHTVILSLCETVGARMRADGLIGTLMTIMIRSNELIGFTHQIPMEAPTDSTSELYKYACQAFDAAWDGHTPIRALGVRVSKMVAERLRQYNLWDGDYYERMSKLDLAVDHIRKDYGEDSVFRASLLSVHGRKMAGGLHVERRTGMIGAV